MGGGEVRNSMFWDIVYCTDVPQRINVGVRITDRSCLIMDEIDSMSAGDRGGVGALATLIRKTKVSLFPRMNASSLKIFRFPSYAFPTIVAPSK